MPADKNVRYTAVTEAGYHYPAGYIALSQSVPLTEDEAERGLAAGLLAPTPEAPEPPEPAKAAPAPENEENS